MSSTERYLDRVGLKQYTDELNAHLKGRMKYIGEAPIYQDTTAKTRTNWNDLIVISGTPSLIGNIFKLSGTSGDTVEVGGVTYMVGEYIIVTNEVDADTAGVLSDDITVMKFSSETAIDDISITHNADAQLQVNCSSTGALGFNTDGVGVQLDSMAGLQITTDNKLAIKPNGSTIARSPAGIYVQLSPTGALGAFSTGLGVKADGITTNINSSSNIYSKSAIEITDFPTDPLSETMYRLTADVTVGTETYKAGLYIYDATNTKWIIQNPETVIDEKTIIKNSDSKLETAVGGWKETGSSVRTVNLTKEANEFRNQVSGSDYYLEGIIDNDTYTLLTNNNQATLNNLTFANSDDTYFVNYVGTQSATKAADGKYTFNIEFNVQNVIIENITAVIDTSTGTNVMRFYLLNGASSFFIGDYYRGDNTIEVTVIDDVYHPLESKYLNIDEISIINEEGITGEETGVLHAKSAIEITAFPTSPLTETIYHLTADITVGTETYKAGLYIYDAANAKWILQNSATNIDEKTIVKNTDDKIETAVGGWKEEISQTDNITTTTAGTLSDSGTGTSLVTVPMVYTCSFPSTVNNIIIKNLVVTINGTAYTCASQFVRNYELITVTIVGYKLGSFTISDGTNTLNVTECNILENTSASTYYVYMDIENNSAIKAGDSVSVTVDLEQKTGYSYHPIKSEYLQVDGTTVVKTSISGAETLALRAKSAIEITTFPTDPFSETIYRLTADTTIGTEEYKAGLYVYDAANTKWINVGGSPIDEKTIVKNTDGELETAVGGWKDGSSSIDRNISTSAAVTLALKSGTTNEFEFAANPALSVFEDKESNVLISNFTAIINGKTYTATSTQTVSYQTFGTTFFGYKISNLDITDGTYTMNISLEFLEDETYPAYYAQNLSLIDNNAILSAGETIEFNFNFKVDKSVYHPLESKYVNIDEVSIVNEEGITGEETGVLHAKSAIEIATFPTADILTETIYRLTTDVTIGTETYKAGLYVYDEPNTKWISVGGGIYDEKTILTTDDTGASADTHTAVGGWKKTTTLTGLSIDGSATATSSYYCISINNKVLPETKWADLQTFFVSGQKCVVRATQKDDVTVYKDFTLTYNGYSFSGNTAGISFAQGTTEAENSASFSSNDSAFFVAGTEYVFSFDFEDNIVYHPIETKFISIDGQSIYNDTSDTTLETGVLMSHPIINADKIATEKIFSDKQCMYRLEYDTTIDNIKYGRGIYYFDTAGYKWKRMPDSRNGDAIDNKTITNWDCNSSPNYTNIHSDFDGFKTAFDVDFFRDSRITCSWSYDYTAKTGTLTFTTTFDIDLTKLVSGSSIIVRAANGMLADVSFYDTYNGSSWNSGSVVEKNKITISLDSSIAPTFNFAGDNRTGGLKFNTAGINYHTLSNNYINIDNNTIYEGTDTNDIDGNKYLHAKSAIEITAFPTEPLNETIYRLLNEVTVGTETYKAGLYVYDITTSAWKSLSADVAIDEKTIIKNTDDKIETAVGGWKEEDVIHDIVTHTDSGTILKDNTSSVYTSAGKLSYVTSSFANTGTCQFTAINISLDGMSYMSSQTYTVVYTFINDDASYLIQGNGYELEDIVLTSATGSSVTIPKIYYLFDDASGEYTLYVYVENNKYSNIACSITTIINGTTQSLSVPTTSITNDESYTKYPYYEISGNIHFTPFTLNLDNAVVNNFKITIDGTEYTCNTSIAANKHSFATGYDGYELTNFVVTDGVNNITIPYIGILSWPDRTVYYEQGAQIERTIASWLNKTCTIDFELYEDNGTTYHPLESNYINIDGISLVNDTSVVGAETGTLHAKSAIEISTFPTSPLTETMYRLTSDVTISGTTYKAGLYVYDITTSAWKAAVGSSDVAIDEKTIIKGDDDKIKTCIGGYSTETTTTYTDSGTETYPSVLYVQAVDFDLTNYPSSSATVGLDYIKVNKLNISITTFSGTTTIHDLQKSVIAPAISVSGSAICNFVYSGTINLTNSLTLSKVSVYVSESAHTFSIRFSSVRTDIASITINVEFTHYKVGISEYINSNYILCSSSGGLMTSADGLAIKLNSTGGLQTTSDGASIKIATRYNQAYDVYTDSTGLRMIINFASNGGLIAYSSLTQVGVAIKEDTTTTAYSGLAFSDNGVRVNYSYGTSLPSSGTNGQIFYLIS